MTPDAMRSRPFTYAFEEREATCIGCGCSDDNACMTERGPCYWLAVDRQDTTGVCSQCEPHLAGWLARHPEQLGADVRAAVDLTDDAITLVGAGFAYRRAFSPFGIEHARTELDSPGFAGEQRDTLLERCNRVAELLRELLPDSPATLLADGLQPRPHAVCPQCGTQGKIALSDEGEARTWWCRHCGHREIENLPANREDNPL